MHNTRPPSIRDHFKQLPSSQSLTGVRFEPVDLIATVQGFGWRALLSECSQMATLFCNWTTGDETFLRETSRLLSELASSDNPLTARVGHFYSANPNAPAYTEQSLYLLQGLALLYGNDGDLAPTSQNLALMALMANDYILKWQDDATSDLRDDEIIAADMLVITRSSRRGDKLFQMVRPLHILNPTNARGALAVDEWESIQQQAFGASLHDYYHGFAWPLYMTTRQWGLDGKNATPLLKPDTWTMPTKLGAEWGRRHFERMTATRDMVQTELKRLSIDGIPSAAGAAFARWPFIRITSDTLVAISPMLVWDHLKYGIWAQILGAFKARDAKSGAKRWFGMFGDMVEGWCRKTALSTNIPSNMNVQILLPTETGAADEIEDVVIADERRVALVSVKSRVIPHDVARVASSRAETVRWLRSFFFADQSPRGAVRLLDAKTRRLRDGKFADHIPRDAIVFPVIVGYEDLGENPGLYRWLQLESKRRQLLQQPNVHPVTVMSIDQFEKVLAAVGVGVNPLDLLELRASAEHGSLSAVEPFLNQLAPNVPYPSWVRRLADSMADGVFEVMFAEPGEEPPKS